MDSHSNFQHPTLSGPSTRIWTPRSNDSAIHKHNVHPTPKAPTSDVSCNERRPKYSRAGRRDTRTVRGQSDLAAAIRQSSDGARRNPLPTIQSSDFLSDWRQNSVLNAPMQLSSSLLASSLASIREGHHADPPLAPNSNSFSVMWRAATSVPRSTSDSHQASNVGSSEQGLTHATPSENPTSVLQRLRNALSQNGTSLGGHETTKRRKLNAEPVPHEANTALPSSLVTSNPQPLNGQPSTAIAAEQHMELVNCRVKREPSPSPAGLHPRPIKEGTKLYSPLPDNLRRTNYNYAEHRKEWLGIEQNNMKKAGLIPTRAFFREDGVSIDWKCKVAVMSDTLLPAPVGPSIAITNVATANPDTSIILPLSPHLNLTTISIESSEINETLDIGIKEFLTRYIQTFDKDRASLASAYARTGTFSCQIHRPASCPSSSASIKSLFSTIECGWKQGRLNVSSTLVSIDPRFKLVPESNGVDFPVDSTWLASGLFLVTCYVQLVSGRDRVSVDMVFVLRDKNEDAEDKIMDGLWSPLVIVAHQMTFRDPNNFVLL